MALSFNSQLSSFLPREDFFSGNETSLSINNLDDSGSPNSSCISVSSSTSPRSNSSKSCPNVPEPLSQPNNDTIISRYRTLIERRTIPGIKSIEELTSWKFKGRECAIGCVFGVVKSVRDSRGTKFKYVTIIDPTDESGIELETFEMQDKIAVGQMMKSCNLKVQRTGSTVAFMFTTSTKTSFFPLFSYNYDSPMGDERNKALTETRFSLPEDREICHILEKWFSLKILNGTKLSNLPAPGEFVDICCQVLAYNKSPLCMNAVIWDTTQPKYKPLFGADGRPFPGLECINYDYFHVAYEKYFALSVWKEESRDQAQHYDTFRCIDLTTGDDLVVLFNLQVIEDTNHPGKASLVMRSSRRWGKAVRLCHWNSILGRMFLHQCKEYRIDFRRKLGLPDSDVVDKPEKKNSPSRQTPSKSIITSTPIHQDPNTVNTPQACSGQNNFRNSIQSNLHQSRLSSSNVQVEMCNEQFNQSEEQNQANQASISDFNASKANTSPVTLDSNTSQAINKHNESKKRKSVDENLTQQLRSDLFYADPIPSTSGYSLRSQRRIATSSSTINQQPTNESDHVDLLTRLKTKAGKFLSWHKLLSNGLERLKLLQEVLIVGDLQVGTTSLTREEHIQYIEFAIDHLEKQKQSASPSPPINKKLRSPENHNDSDDSFMIFPFVDRVKYVYNN